MEIQIGVLEYRINKMALIKPAIIPFIMVVFCIALFLPLISSTTGIKTFYIACIPLVIVCFNVIPSVILHINYYRHDKDKVLIINKSKELLIIVENNKAKEIPFNEIAYLEKLRPGIIIGSIVSHGYYYYCINLKSGKSHNISGFLIQRLEKKLTGISFDDVECFYPYIKKT
jgi:hypothetical protein